MAEGVGEEVGGPGRQVQTPALLVGTRELVHVAVAVMVTWGETDEMVLR